MGGEQLIEPSARCEMVENTPDDPRKRKPDITKAETILRWKPTVHPQPPDCTSLLHPYCRSLLRTYRAPNIPPYCLPILRLYCTSLFGPYCTSLLRLYCTSLLHLHIVRITGVHIGVLVIVWKGRGAPLSHLRAGWLIGYGMKRWNGWMHAGTFSHVFS